MPELLHTMQQIRLVVLRLGASSLHLVTGVPPDINQTLARLDLLRLFAPPDWAQL